MGTHELKSAWVTVCIGALRIGLPLQTVVQAVPRPPDLQPLPRRSGALCGVFTGLGRPVPVLDLSLWVELGASMEARSARSRIVVLREAGRELGLLVDAVDGLVELAADAVLRLHHDDGAEEVFHSVGQLAGDPAPLHLLDVKQLMALANVWSDGGNQQVDDARPSAEASDTIAWAIIDSGGVRVAVPAVEVGELVPVQVEAASMLGRGEIRDWRGRHVPVIDPASVLGSGGATAGAYMLVICRDGLALALKADRVAHIRSLRHQEGRNAVTATMSSLVLGVNMDEGIPVHMLDTAALFEQFPEVAISRADSGTYKARGHDGRRNSVSYIVFKAGTMLASPLDALEEVQAARSGPAPATVDWRGQALAVADLRPGRDNAGQMIVVRNHGRLRGVIIDEVCALITPNSATLTRVPLPGAQFDMITVGQGAEQASYRIMDLGQATLPCD